MNIPVLVFSYSNCSTCKKALKWLKENNIEHEIREIINQPPDKKTLRIGLQKYCDRKKLFNTRGLSYREIGPEKINQMSQEEIIDCLHSDGKLIKRPFLVINSDEIIVGFNRDLWAEKLIS